MYSCVYGTSSPPSSVPATSISSILRPMPFVVFSEPKMSMGHVHTKGKSCQHLCWLAYNHPLKLSAIIMMHLRWIDCHEAGSKLSNSGKDPTNPVVALVTRIGDLEELYWNFLGTFSQRFIATGGPWQVTVSSSQELDVQFGNVCKLFSKIKIKIKCSLFRIR